MRKKFTRQEKKEIQKSKLLNNMTGSGIYIYENNTDGDLNLPKPTSSGVRMIGPRKRFQGDSYYMKWVGSPMNLLRLIEEVVPQNALNENKENSMIENKLILDQPDTVTSKGKVEHVINDSIPVQAINDSNDSDAKKTEILLNESPIDGLEIILGWFS